MSPSRLVVGKMNEVEGDELMRRAAGGDLSAFDLIVRRHQDRVQRFATRMLGGNSADGGDVAVATFLRLWEKRDEFKPCGQLEAWLLRTAYRLTLDLLRTPQTASIEDRLEPCGPSGFQAVTQSALTNDVRDAIMELPEGQRAVIVLSVCEGLSYEAIAETLDIPPGTVASRRNGAVATLKRRLVAWQD